MKVTYITDRFSTLGGLGAVAYGDPEYFREVQNQIYYQSPTQFADVHRPSDAFESLISSGEALSESFISILEGEYAMDEEIADCLDIEYGPGWRSVIAKKIYPLLQTIMDSTSSYEFTSQDYFKEPLKVLFPTLSEEALDLLSDKTLQLLQQESFSSLEVELALSTITNNPQTKLSTPPPDSQVSLESNISSDLDYRGVSISTGYSTIEDYWSNVPYPGFTDVNIVPSTLKESILNGYVGYLSNSPLESLYNPIASSSINDLDIFSPESLNFSSPFSTGSVLGQLPKELQGDQGVYSISLIGERLNGYTTYDPATMSNGDFIDQSLIPDFEEQNADSDGGLPGLARTFSSPF